MPEEVSLDALLREATIGIVGEEDVVSGFRALGFKAYPVTKGEEFKTIFSQLLKDKTVICLVEEDIYLAAQPEINNYKQLPFPIFIPFSKTGKMNLLDDILKKIRLKATGVV